MQKVECAWCGALMQDGQSEHVSHGMCARCAEKMNAALRDTCVTCRGVGAHHEGCVNDRPWAV